MPCRVGITTDSERRKAEWESQVVGLTNWKILKTFHSKTEAQAYENAYANRTGCQAHAGGTSAFGPWHVYRFDYTRTCS